MVSGGPESSVQGVGGKSGVTANNKKSTTSVTNKTKKKVNSDSK